MNDEQLRTHIEHMLRDRVTPISSPAILTHIPYGPDYERGRELIWEMVEAGQIERRKLKTQARAGTSFINVYRWIE